MDDKDFHDADNESYVTKDSGKREEFDTGAKRDTQEGKPRYDLIPPDAWERVALLYARGAEKYGENNWEKGIPFMRVWASLMRHAMSWRQGDESEDHLAAVVWNALTLMEYCMMVDFGELPSELDNR